MTLEELENSFETISQKYRTGTTEKDQTLNLQITQCLLNLREQIEILKAIELLEKA